MTNHRVPTSPVEFAGLVVERLLGGAPNETLRETARLIERFSSFVQYGCGVVDVEQIDPEHAQAFVESRRMDGASPSRAIRVRRRSAMRLAFRTGRQLGITRNEPTLDIDIGPYDRVSARPLTDAEIELGRSHALASLQDRRRSIAWALAEATAQTSEMGSVRVGDVDVEEATVRLPGGPSTDPRRGHFTDWGLAQVRRRLDGGAEQAAPLIVWRRRPAALRPTCSQALQETLKAAGLHAPDVKPRSIVAWRGRKLLEAGAPIDEVARQLGMRSLDQVAELIRFPWRGTPG